MKKQLIEAISNSDISRISDNLTSCICFLDAKWTLAEDTSENKQMLTLFMGDGDVGAVGVLRITPQGKYRRLAVAPYLLPPMRGFKIPGALKLNKTQLIAREPEGFVGYGGSTVRFREYAKMVKPYLGVNWCLAHDTYENGFGELVITILTGPEQFIDVLAITEEGFHAPVGSVPKKLGLHVNNKGLIKQEKTDLIALACLPNSMQNL